MPESLDEKYQALSDYRLKRAKELIDVSEELLENNHLKDSINRSYYAMFSALKSVLALDGFDSKKHFGVISEFRKSYIKTGKLPEEYSKYIGIAFEIRNSSDYDDMYIVAREDAVQQLEHAKELVEAIDGFIHLIL